MCTHIIDGPHNNLILLAEGATTLDIAEGRKQDVHIRQNESSREELGTAYRQDQEYGRGRYDAQDHGRGISNRNLVES